MMYSVNPIIPAYVRRPIFSTQYTRIQNELLRALPRSHAAAAVAFLIGAIAAISATSVEAISRRYREPFPGLS